MKRPLCAIALILTAAVLLYLELFNTDHKADAGCLRSGGLFAVTCEYDDGDHAEVTGVVRNKETVKGYTGEDQCVIYVSPVAGGSGAASAADSSQMVQCYLEESDDSFPAIGTYVRLSGRVRLFSSPSNPGEFDSRLYYSTLKISYRLTGVKVLAVGGRPDKYRETLFGLKEILGASLDAALTPEDAGIMKAMLLGDKSSMDRDIQERFKASGVAHILAISGTHIAVLGMGLYELLRRVFLRIGILAESYRLRRNTCFHRVRHPDSILSALLAIMAMYSYGVMCGMSSSAFRAILMFSLRLLAPMSGRTYDVLSALAMAEILLLLDQPLYLYNSGFLMSFGAVVGIAVVKPRLAPLSWKTDIKMRFVDDAKNKSLIDGNAGITGFVLNGFQASIAIGITTLPVYGLFYYTYPLHSILINLLVIPVMGILLAMGVVCMAFGAPTLGVGGTLIHAVTLLPAFGIHVIIQGYKMLSYLSILNAHLTWYMGHVKKWQVAVYILLLVIFVLMSDGIYKPGLLQKLLRSFKGYTFEFDVVRFGILAVAIVLLTFRNTQGLSIHAIDVGQGDSILISSDGHNLLIDGGSTSKKNTGKYIIIPFLKYQGIGCLDGVVVTHEDEDHISGILELMDDMEKGGIRINKLILPEVAETSRGDNYHLLESRAGKLKIPILYINSSESFALGKVSFTCLNPSIKMYTEEANEYSTVLYMQYGQFTALFTGDMEGVGLENVKAQLREMQIDEIKLLKVAHHGSRYTTDDEFLEITKPSIALISCGRGNSYGHPHQELIERLEAAGTTIYRTDECGAIKITVGDKEIKINSFLK